MDKRKTMQLQRRVIPTLSYFDAQKWLIWRGLPSYRKQTKGLGQ
jgi:hypothetical protein